MFVASLPVREELVGGVERAEPIDDQTPQRV